MYWIDVSYKVSLFSLFFREKRHLVVQKNHHIKGALLMWRGLSFQFDRKCIIGLFVFSLFKFIFPGMIQRENIIQDVNSELMSCMIKLTCVYDFMFNKNKRSYFMIFF
jgi:hypothetical protein